MAARHELGAKLAIVLDDAVVDDDESPVQSVRVGVLHRRTAVGRPARVPDADVAGRQSVLSTWRASSATLCVFLTVVTSPDASMIAIPAES